MIPRFRPPLGAKEIAACFLPASINNIAFFEDEFAKKSGQKHAVFFPYGRVGLLFLLKALDIKDSEVLCPAYTCVVVSHAIVESGNEPVFVDSAADDFNMDLKQAEKKVTSKTAALISTSLFGIPVDLDQLQAFKNKFPKVLVIQDCAHSFWVEHKKRSVAHAGIAAIYGLNISKLLTSVFGGMVTTNNSALAQKLTKLRDRDLKPGSVVRNIKKRIYTLSAILAFTKPFYSAINFLERKGFLDRFVTYFSPETIEMPGDGFIMASPFEARIGRIQIRAFTHRLKQRLGAASVYFKNLSAIKPLRLPPNQEGSTFSHFVVRTRDRNKLLETGLKKGIQFGQIVDYSIPAMASYRKRPGSQGTFPFAAEHVKTVLNLPLQPPLSNQLIVINFLKKYA